MNDKKFGPGTLVAIPVVDKRWKAKAGAIINKRRPEAVYVTMSSWVTPSDEFINARMFDEAEYNQVAQEALKEFKRDICRSTQHFKKLFSSSHFKPETLILNVDLAVDRAAKGKAQFLELDLHVETRNEIDDDGNPISDGSGKIEFIPFSDMLAQLVAVADGVTGSNVFSTDKVQFTKTKKV
jgi:hypothetical protein